MTSLKKSRWADDDEDEGLQVQRKREKELKKQAKVERQRRLDEERLLGETESTTNGSVKGHTQGHDSSHGDSERPAKRRRISAEPEGPVVERISKRLLHFPAPEWGPCRHVDNFEKLNHIEEGSYGWVSRAKEIATGEVVALKKLKMDNANDGFPVTGLREIQTLMASRHTNIVALREVVMGDKLDE